MIPRAAFRDLEAVLRASLRAELAPVLAELELLRSQVAASIERAHGDLVVGLDFASGEDETVRSVARTILAMNREEPTNPPPDGEEEPLEHEPEDPAVALARAAAALPPRSRRRYADEEVLQVKRDLAETGSPAKTARRLRMPITTVHAMRASKRWDTLFDPAARSAPPPPVEPVAVCADVPVVNDKEVDPPASTMPVEPPKPAPLDEEGLRRAWADPKLRRADIMRAHGISEGELDRRARDLGLGAKARDFAQVAAVPLPPSAAGLEPVPASEEDARDWLFAQLKRERMTEAEIEIRMAQADRKAIFAGCNARRVKLGLPPYVPTERAA